MPNCHKRSSRCRIPLHSELSIRLFAVSVIVLLVFQTACLFKKSKAPVVSLTSARIVMLPFNVPAGNPDLRWLAMAGPVLLAKASEQNRDVTVVPLWDAMPAAIESAGASRTLTPESTISAANWLSGDWAALGEISAVKSGVSLSIDFLPVKTNQIPFRYIKTRKVDVLAPCFPEAFKQFMRYLMVKLPEQRQLEEQKIILMKPLAEALDREYGWSGRAEPGKAQEVVSELLSTDERLARFLFNPSVYPALTQTK